MNTYEACIRRSVNSRDYVYSSAETGFLNVVLLPLCRRRVKGCILATHFWNSFHFQEATFSHSLTTYSKFYQTDVTSR
jgi:hypothetical protein